ncbi:MAG TPA: MarR family transcriptional regulator [Pyrinomonadaceae bacterium]|nr:MarR family transcriptional regulator [Pyrinomonadaceae bacterium]
MHFEESAAYLLAKATVAHRNALEKHVNSVGLHSGQVFVLMELWKSDGQRQIDLAARLNLSPPTVNKILGGLLENDFVTRAKYEDDARSTRIFLTEKGVQVKEDLEQAWDVLEDQTLANLTDTEALMLKQLLQKLAE